MNALKEELFELIAKNPLASNTYLVGGSLRDEQLGIKSKDFDFAVEVENGAESITSFLHNTYPDLFTTPYKLGAQYPIWQVTWKGLEIQFADTHREKYPDQDSRQRVLEFAGIEEDCRRRDFTINMLYQRVSDRELLDISSTSLTDIKNKTLRVHPQETAEQIFFEDPLRIVRMLRFASCFEMKATEETLEGAKNQKKRLNVLSQERVRDELIKVILKGKLATFLSLAQNYTLLDELFPELIPMIGCTQDSIYHAEGDVWTHTLLVLKHTPNTLLLQLAALLHDIGKPPTRSEHGERIKFLGHEKISASMASEFLKKRKFSANLTEDTVKLVRLHLRGSDCSKWSGMKAARRFVRDTAPLTEELVQLIEADSSASLSKDGTPRLDHITLLRKLVEEAQQIPIEEKPILNGQQIMATLKIKPGPVIGEVQAALTELSDDWAEHGKILSIDEAIKWLNKNKEKFS